MKIYYLNKKVDTSGFATSSFTTFQTDNGTYPVATGPNDTITFTSSDGTIVITGNAGTDTIDFAGRVANGSVSGIISTTDYNTFNNKQTAITIGTTLIIPAPGGLDLTTGVLTLLPADTSYIGGVSTGTQSFTGTKTFIGLNSTTLNHENSLPVVVQSAGDDGSGGIFQTPNISVFGGAVNAATPLSLKGQNQGGGNFGGEINFYSGSGANVQAIFGANEGGAGNIGFVGTKTNNDFRIRTNDVDIATFSAAGRLLLGTVADDGSGQILQINGGINSNAGINSVTLNYENTLPVIIAAAVNDGSGAKLQVNGGINSNAGINSITLNYENNLPVVINAAADNASGAALQTPSLSVNGGIVGSGIQVAVLGSDAGGGDFGGEIDFISGPSGVTALMGANEGTSGNIVYFGSKSAGTDVRLRAANADVVTITSTGHVLIGTTVDNGSGNILQIGGSAEVVTNLKVDGLTTLTTSLTVQGVSAQSADMTQWLNNSTTILANVSSAGIIGTVAGTSTVLAKVGGRLNNQIDQKTCSSTTETNLHTYSLAANSLKNVGDTIEIKAAGQLAASAFTKRIRAYLGTTVILDTGALGITGATDWAIEGICVKTGSNTQKCIVTFSSSSATLSEFVQYTSTSRTDTSAIVIKTTGQEGTTGGTDIHEEIFTIDYQPAF